MIERPIKTVDVRRHNLPDYLTSFVGRTRELDELAGLIERNRLVALTGVGGTGKTRLAVEAARSAASKRPDGAWLVELASVTNPQFIMTTIADTWGLRAGEGAASGLYAADIEGDGDIDILGALPDKVAWEVPAGSQLLINLALANPAASAQPGSLNIYVHPVFKPMDVSMVVRIRVAGPRVQLITGVITRRSMPV